MACKDFLTEVQARLWCDLKLQPWLPGSSRDLSFFLYNSYLKGPSSLKRPHLLVIPLPPMLKWHLTEDEIIPPHISWLADIRFNMFLFSYLYSPQYPQAQTSAWLMNEWREYWLQKALKKSFFMNLIQAPPHSTFKKKSKSLKAQIYVVILEKILIASSPHSGLLYSNITRSIKPWLKYAHSTPVPIKKKGIASLFILLNDTEGQNKYPNNE